MGIRFKFNLVLLAVFVLGLAVSGYISYNLLHNSAREVVLQNAGVMMEAALSMRHYTVSEVSDKLAVNNSEFLPQSVPAFAATEIMNQLRKKYPDYAYKEASVNPTNPRLLIVRPITRMSAAADQISTGSTDIPELAESGKDEVAMLATSFNRMRRSLEKAMQMIER